MAKPKICSKQEKMDALQRNDWMEQRVLQTYLRRKDGINTVVLDWNGTRGPISDLDVLERLPGQLRSHLIVRLNSKYIELFFSHSEKLREYARASSQVNNTRALEAMYSYSLQK
jgi:hypothetical protein